MDQNCDFLNRKIKITIEKLKLQKLKEGSKLRIKNYKETKITIKKKTMKLEDERKMKKGA